jgi:Mg-chelatase subunit ChlD
MVFEPSDGGQAGMVLQASGRPQRKGAAGEPGATTESTLEEGSEALSIDLDHSVDPATLALARDLARRLALRRPRRDVSSRRGAGELASMRYAGSSDEIDLDATLERLAANPVPDDDDIIVRDRLRTRRSVVLVVDVSGSMRGERIRTAAATVGALLPELAVDDLAVIAFWSDAAVPSQLGRPVQAGRLLDTLLRIPAKGLTNVAFPLELARRQLAGVPRRDARVVLLSDCVHNAGPDPRNAASRLPRLDVLVDVSGEHDTALGRALARLGRGRFRELHNHHDVPPAIGAFFDQ